jgi:hypothetical protein
MHWVKPTTVLAKGRSISVYLRQRHFTQRWLSIVHRNNDLNTWLWIETNHKIIGPSNFPCATWGRGRLQHPTPHEANSVRNLPARHQTSPAKSGNESKWWVTVRRFTFWLWVSIRSKSVNIFLTDIGWYVKLWIETKFPPVAGHLNRPFQSQHSMMRRSRLSCRHVVIIVTNSFLASDNHPLAHFRSKRVTHRPSWFLPTVLPRRYECYWQAIDRVGPPKVEHSSRSSESGRDSPVVCEFPGPASPFDRNCWRLLWSLCSALLRWAVSQWESTEAESQQLFNIWSDCWPSSELLRRIT